MTSIRSALESVVAQLSDENYAESLAFHRVWFDVDRMLDPDDQTTSDRIFRALWNNKGGGGSESHPEGALTHSNAHLIVRFASDIESDHALDPRSSGLQSRLCRDSLRAFFKDNVAVVWYSVSGCVEPRRNFYVHTNRIAHWVNLGCVEETTIRSRILQSLISHPKLHLHQADALLVLFKLAGATFEAYADASVIDRCFELLNGHCHIYSSKMNLLQEVVALRERGWEGLPPPPVFETRVPKPAGASKEDAVATSLGLPNGASDPQIPSLGSFIAPVSNTVPVAPVTPITQSPSISIATLSDFTVPDTSDDELPVDSTTMARHGIFYLGDGDVEVLCENTLFRAHTSILSFHSSALGRMVSQTSLITAKPTDGCPRIQSSDTAADFATLLKMIYLPGFPERGRVPDFVTFSSLLRVTTKYEMSVVRSQMLDVVRDAYPETFEGLAPSKTIGERVFSGPTPHPNEVLNLEGTGFADV